MLPDAVGSAIAPTAQVRRAWVVLAAAFVVFALLVGGSVAGGVWVYRHATVPETATLHVVSGSGALVRSPTDADWRLVTSGTTVRENDSISTALGTVVLLTMFDGSTVEVSEDTVVKIDRMRSSRFLHRTKLIALEPERGTVYVAMSPRGQYRYSEFVVRTGPAHATMSDGVDHHDAGSFLVEARTAADGSSGTTAVRVAVLRGAATVVTSAGPHRLESNQQTVIGADGSVSPVEAAVRELVHNGDFRQGLDGWVSFAMQAGQAADPAMTGASIELVADHGPRGPVVAAEFLRGSVGSTPTQIGLRQRIGQTLRVHSSLQLAFEIRITDQQPLGGGDDRTQFPFVIELRYLDVDGQERTWTHGYYVVADPRSPVPQETGTRVDRDEWQRIVFDLRNLSPAPRQITSVVVYASGESYQTRVANVSLSSGELVEPDS